MATIQVRTDKDGKKKYTATIRLKGHPAQTATFARRQTLVSGCRIRRVRSGTGVTSKLLKQRSTHWRKCSTAS